MAKNGTYYFTSESVTEGHPDKIADQISDSILDAILDQDPKGRVACETLVTTGMVFIAGEISTEAYVDFPSVVRNTVREVGYTRAKYGFDYETCAVISSIDEQSPDIAQGVNTGGAGDQGIMFGYACDENELFMPTPITLAHRICRRLAEVRKNEILDFVRPDGKSQVTVQYDANKPVRCDVIVCSTQHSPEIPYNDLKETIIEEVIKPSIPEHMIDRDTTFHVNPTGSFERGGPWADTGLTGRKIIVDTYGGVGSHGGGAFSGKDPTKVDRSASYMARHLAKNLVAAGAAQRMEIQLGYAIGVKDPVAIMVDTFNTSRVDEDKIIQAIRELFPLDPAGMIQYLELSRPIYAQTAAYGHFGRTEPEFTWEKTHRISEIKEMLGL